MKDGAPANEPYHPVNVYELRHRKSGFPHPEQPVAALRASAPGFCFSRTGVSLKMLETMIDPEMYMKAKDRTT